MCSQKLLTIFLSFSIIFFVFSGKVFAASPQITAYPGDSIGLNQSFTVTATMSGLSKTSVYRMRIVLSPTGTSNYFGSTWNGTSWYNGTPSPINYANFYSITTDTNGAWSGDIQGEIDPDDPNFTTGGGTYDMKVGRYTQTGSTATWSNIVNMTVVLPPSPSSTPTPTITPTTTPIPVTPTRRPVPSPTPTTKIISPTVALTGIDTSSFGAVLGTMSAVSPAVDNHPTLIAAQQDERKTVTEIFPLLVIVAGFGLLASCGILVFFQSDKGKYIWRKFL